MPIRDSRINRPELPAIEVTLQHTLVPVAPRRSFVDRLDNQLHTAPEAPQVILRPSRQAVFLFSLAGAFTVLLFLSAGFRVAVALVSALSLINTSRQPFKRGKTTRLTPAG